MNKEINITAAASILEVSAAILDLYKKAVETGETITENIDWTFNVRDEKLWKSLEETMGGMHTGCGEPASEQLYFENGMIEFHGDTLLYKWTSITVYPESPFGDDY